MKKAVSLILSLLIILSVIVSTGCNTADTTEYLTLDYFIQSTNEKNLNELQKTSTYDEAEYLIDYENEVFTEEEKSALLTGGYNRVTKEEAKHDIETLFKFLKRYYAGYTYFGGDEKFNNAKQEILNNIDSSSKSKFNTNDLAEIITPSLSFVYDSHFKIGGKQTFKEAYTYYETSKMEFYKDSNGYYTKIDDKIWYLPKELEKYLKVTIGKSGELVYGMFAVVVDESTLPKEAELYNNSKKNKVNLTWVVSEVGGDQASVTQYSEENEIPISSLSFMDPNEFTSQQFNEFLNNSQKHAEKENSILDLRENDGGIAEVDWLWVYGYTGQYTDITWSKLEFPFDGYAFENDVTVTYDNMFNEIDLLKNNPDVKTYFENLNNDYDPTAKMISSDNMFNVEIDNLLENENKLFVLQSKHNYSSGEIFINMLHNIENVLTVGTNTNGCIHTGMVSAVGLPNSGLGIGYSQAILIGAEKELDIYGLEPDIYIASEDAQDAVLRCIEYYNNVGE